MLIYQSDGYGGGGVAGAGGSPLPIGVSQPVPPIGPSRPAKKKVKKRIRPYVPPRSQPTGDLNGMQSMTGGGFQSQPTLMPQTSPGFYGGATPAVGFQRQDNWNNASPVAQARLRYLMSTRGVGAFRNQAARTPGFYLPGQGGIQPTNGGGLQAPVPMQLPPPQQPMYNDYYNRIAGFGGGV